MRVYTHISCGATQALSFSIRDVLPGLRISVLFRHTKVDDMDKVGVLGPGAANEKVVGLDITINQILFVDGLCPCKLFRICSQL